MSYLEDIMQGLEKNQEVPKHVQDKVELVLENLPDKKRKVRKNWQRQTAAAAAVMVAISGVLCYSYPTLAARIPLIGKIFEQVEESVPFSGDYSEKAETLIAPEDMEGSKMIVTDAGICVTASEVYCDSVSVFLAAQIEVPEENILKIPSHTLNGKEATADGMYLRGTWMLEGEEQRMLNARMLEGKVIDEHTFAGVLKLDLEDKELKTGTLNLQLTSIGWDQDGTESLDISENMRVDGVWNFTIPFTVDGESVKEIVVNQEENGYTIQKIIVSPYQVVSYVKAPLSRVEKEITRADYERKLGLAEGEEDKTLSYEDFLAEYQTPKMQPCETVICNQDGEFLFANDSSTTSGITTFAVDKKELRTLSVYVLTDVEDYCNEDGSLNRELLSARAVVAAEVDLF